MNKNQHIIPHNGKWAIKGENNSKVTQTFNTQSEAIKTGKQIAQNQNSELVIHRPDGRIRDKESYGNDPRNIKG